MMSSMLNVATQNGSKKCNHRRDIMMLNIITQDYMEKLSKTRYLSSFASSASISNMFHHRHRNGLMLSTIYLEGRDSTSKFHLRAFQRYSHHRRLLQSSSSYSRDHIFSASVPATATLSTSLSSSSSSSLKKQPTIDDDINKNDDNNLFLNILNNNNGTNNDGTTRRQQLLLPRREYLNPWSYDDIQPLEICPKLDRHSRFLLNLIQTMYETTLTHTSDRVTTDRANFLLQQLLHVSEEDNENNHGADATNTTSNDDYDSSVVSSSSSSNDGKSHHTNNTSKLWHQKAERARAILECMELFDIYRDINQKLPFVIPHPNHETYWTVLRLYGNIHLQGYDPNQEQPTTKSSSSSLSSSLSVLRSPPRICEGIVRRMENSKRLELKPSSIHYNQVLASWANSSDENRSIEAAKLLYELHHNNSSNINNVTDASSFAHTIRACIPISEQELIPNSKFSKLALPVAIRIWKALIQEHHKSVTTAAATTSASSSSSSSIQISSFHITHMLRVCKNISDPKNRVILIKEIFDKAIETRSVNYYVLHALFHVDTGIGSSNNVNSKVVGGSSSSSSILKDYYLGSDHSNDPKKAIQQIPKEWLAVSNDNQLP